MGWANFVISGDPDRPIPRILVSDDDAPEGESALLRFPTNEAEAKGIAKIVDGLIQEGVVPSQILILLRGDHDAAFSAPIKRELEAREIAYADPEWVSKLVAENENRRFLAASRLLVNREDSLAWATLLELERGIGPSFVDWLYERARAVGKTLGAKLVEQLGVGYEGGPARSSELAAALVGQILRWLEEHPLPEDSEPWGTWMIEQADGDVVPMPTDDLRELILELDGLTERDLGRFIGQIQPLGRTSRRVPAPAYAS